MRIATDGAPTITRHPPSRVPPGPDRCRPTATDTFGSRNSIGVPAAPLEDENAPVRGSSAKGPLRFWFAV